MRQPHRSEPPPRCRLQSNSEVCMPDICIHHVSMCSYIQITSVLHEPAASHIPAVVGQSNAPSCMPTAAETVNRPPMTLGRRDAHDGKDACDERRASNSMKSSFQIKPGTATTIARATARGTGVTRCRSSTHVRASSHSVYHTNKAYVPEAILSDCRPNSGWPSCAVISPDHSNSGCISP